MCVCLRINLLGCPLRCEGCLELVYATVLGLEVGIEGGHCNPKLFLLSSRFRQKLLFSSLQARPKLLFTSLQVLLAPMQLSRNCWG